MSESQSPHEVDRSLLDQTLYLATRIYDDPHTQPIPLDLHSACAIGSYQSVKDAIQSGVDFNTRNKAGWTPLMYASYVGHDTVVNLLLDSGAEPSRGTHNSLTPLMVAAGCGNESVCYFLLQAGAEIDTQDSNGYTALVHAVRQGHQTVVQLLLEAGADMELADNENGYTALMQASLEGDEIIVDVLVACDADLNAKDKRGETARSLAYKHHHVRTATLLDNAIFMFRPTPDNSNTLPSSESAQDNDQQDDDDDDLFSGAKDAEAYQQSKLVRKSIQEMLGRRSGPRWSLPHEYIAARRSSAPSELGPKQRRRLQAAMSMPEREVLSDLDEDRGESPVDVDHKLVDFLTDLSLEKYIELFREQEIDFQAFLSLTDEDLKRIGVKLMGPRRKISVAVVEYKQQRQLEEEEEEANSSEEQEKRTPQVEGEKENTFVERPSFKTSANRPKLMKQASTELTAAYHQAMERVEFLEEQLSKEHQLRKTTDRYILDLQTARQEAVGCVDQVKGGQKDITTHFKAVRGTHGKLTDEVDCLRLLSSSVVDHDQLHKLYSEIVSLSSKMGLELEALSRSIDASKGNTDTLAFHLGGT